MNLKNSIDKEGYIILSNVLNNNELEYGLSSIKDKMVDYKITKKFIDNILFKKIIKNTDFITDPHYSKFRLSNHNNSKDASLFHGDIYNNTKSELLNIYTCLCYFDDAQMELIPGSHKYNNPGFSIESYNKKKIIEVKRGDILIFHSNIHHRGINYYKTENRRVLQVFRVFPDKETYEREVSKLVIVKTNESTFIKNFIDPIMVEIVKSSTIMGIITFFHYILRYNDLLYKITLIDLSPSDKKDRYVSYEAGSSMRFIDLSGNYNLNVNIVTDTNVIYLPTGTYYLHIFYFILAVIVMFFIIRCNTNGKILPKKKIF